MTRIKQITTNSLSCEPFVRKTAGGELLCIVQCDGPYEPHTDNRVYVFHSRDDGETWGERELLFPEDGSAVYCTEVMVYKDVITAFLTIHNGGFLDWKCIMMQSTDNGYTWKNAGTPPHFPEYTFIRSMIETSNKNILIPYQTYPVTRAEHDRVLREENGRISNNTQVPYCESGVLISTDCGITYERCVACRMDMSDGWIWSEPTIVQLSDGIISMITRKCRSGYLWRCDSNDGGKTWSELYNTNIPNPSNKPRLIKTDDKRIALIHTPNNAEMGDGRWGERYPLQVWISDDDMKTWGYKKTVTDFPGQYSYSDGFYENGHIKFVIEHNRHTVLFVDFEI